MKTLLKSVMMCVLALTMTLHSRPSHAAVGALVGAPAIVVTGLVTAGVGGAGLIAVSACAPDCKEGAVPVFFLGALLAGLGLIILEGEQKVEFKNLSESQAQKLKLTAAEMESFNAEIDKVNALTSFVTEEVVSQNIQNSEGAAELWKSVKDLVSPESFSAMIKVANQSH